MKIEEKGKVYELDEQGNVVSASVKEDFEDEFRLNDRVEVPGVGVGQIISLTHSMYGLAFGVKFDDGEVDEFAEVQLKRSTVEPTSFDSPIQEVYARYEQYAELPAYTEDERERKSSEARWINLKASTLRTYASQGGIRDPKLDEIIIVTGADLRDLKEVTESVADEGNQRYMARFNQYKVADTIGGSAPQMGSKGDMSWVHTGIDGLEIEELQESDLAKRASEVVGNFTLDQLKDDGLMSLAASFQLENLKEKDRQAFSSYLERARTARMSELHTDEASKTASADELNLEDIDISGVFL